MVEQTFSSRLKDLRRRVGEVEAAVQTARARAEQVLLSVGVELPKADTGDVIDVDTDGSLIRNTVKQLVRRTSQGLMLFVAVAVFGVALWSLGIFVGAAMLAFVVVTRGLGLRIDLAMPRAAA